MDVQGQTPPEVSAHACTSCPELRHALSRRSSIRHVTLPLPGAVQPVDLPNNAAVQIVKVPALEMQHLAPASLAVQVHCHSSTDVYVRRHVFVDESCVATLAVGLDNVGEA